MDSIQERLRIWKQESGYEISFELIDLATEYERVKAWLGAWQPDAVIHLAQQRAAPYSMKTDRHKNYTVENNVMATHHLLNAVAAADVPALTWANRTRIHP